MLGSLMKAAKIFKELDPKQTSKLSSELKKDQQFTKAVGGPMREIAKMMMDMEKMTTSVAGSLGDAAKAAAEKPSGKKSPDAKQEKQMKQDAAKAMDSFQAERIKTLEAAVVAAELKLKQLRKYLSDAKKSNPGALIK